LEKEGRLADIPAKDLTYEWWGVSDHLNSERYKGLITVEADTPDNIIAPFRLTNIDFILIETNGTELEIVQSMDDLLDITQRIGARGHVRRDGVPIYFAIKQELSKRKFLVTVTDEGMVLAKKLPE
jgi:hypothetical protein